MLTLVAQRWRRSEILQLSGRVLKTVVPGQRRERLIGSADELTAVLKDDFSLDVPEVATLWSRVVARHEEVMAAGEAARAAAVQPA